MDTLTIMSGLKNPYLKEGRRKTEVGSRKIGAKRRSREAGPKSKEILS